MASGGSKPSTIEDLGVFKSPRRTVVASSKSNSSHIEDLGFLTPQWRIVVASGGSKSSQIEDIGFLSRYNTPSLPLEGRNPEQNEILVV